LKYWWNAGRYEYECRAFDKCQQEQDPALTRALTESGIEVRVRLYCTRPVYYGTFSL
jgi:hypothetical protein